ncbi:MAG: hypothetical protein OEM26_03265 [Saprospiraceae bacterium]|nr:hypothetical protein [Saprospiraceae bacterium]
MDGNEIDSDGLLHINLNSASSLQLVAWVMDGRHREQLGYFLGYPLQGKDSPRSECSVRPARAQWAHLILEEQFERPKANWLIAHEVGKQFPELVHTDQQERNP